jgi:sugar/nucleoside kinase (ribokinase family)
MTVARPVVTIGNAIVDVLSHAEDSFLDQEGLVKGSMNLIDAHRAEELYQRTGPAVEISGGSAANTAAGIASMGGTAAFIGKVCNDQLGDVFSHDIRATGVAFDTPRIIGAPPTARSLILVTPDGHRTMNTMLGACVELGPEDIDQPLIEAARITYLEGYLWDKPKAKDAFLKAAAISHAAGRQVSLTLSDSFCVDRHRDSFRTLIAGHVDILFGNEHEIMALFEVDTLAEAMDRVRGECEIAIITRSEEGSLVLVGDAVHEVRAEPVSRVVDSTGAGDLYAAGFLFGLTDGRHVAECARLGSIAAAEVISHIGARPEASLAGLIAE